MPDGSVVATRSDSRANRDCSPLDAAGMYHRSESRSYTSDTDSVLAEDAASSSSSSEHPAVMVLDEEQPPSSS